MISLSSPAARLGLFATAALLLAGCQNDPPTVVDREVPEALRDAPAPSVPAFEYLVGPGDVLRVNVFGHPELSSMAYRGSTPGTPVEASGSISLPALEPLPVAGLTVFEIRDAITEAYRKYLRQPRVDVSVIEFGANRVYILGEVRQPGMFVLDRPLHLIQALALAGGFNEDANREHIALIRGAIAEENLFLVDAENLDPAASALLQPNDVIFVGRREWASVGAAARDIVPILQVLSLPVGTARDVALFNDLVGN